MGMIFHYHDLVVNGMYVCAICVHACVRVSESCVCVRPYIGWVGAWQVVVTFRCSLVTF